MQDDITRAVLAREDVARYLKAGERPDRARGPRADPGLPRRTADDAALSDLPRAEAPALSDPAQGRSHRRARRHRARAAAAAAACSTSRTTRATSTTSSSRSILDDNGIRPPIIAAGINLFGGPLGLHPPPRHRRHPDPPQRQGPGVSRHAQGLRRRDAQAPRPAVLPRGRPQLQRRDQGAEDGPAPRRDAGRRDDDRRSCRWPSPTTSCSRTGSWRARAPSARSGRSPRELAEMVGAAVGYQSRAFVTFGHPIPLGGLGPRIAPRRPEARARHARRRSAGCTRCCRARSSRRPMRPSMSRRDLRAARRGARRAACGARGANLDATDPARDRRRAASTCSRPAASSSASARCCACASGTRSGTTRARSNICSCLPARTPGPTDAGRPVEELLPRPGRQRDAQARRVAVRHARNRRASRAGSSPARRSRRPSRAAREIEARGLTLTLDLLGESVTSLDAAAAATRGLPRHRRHGRAGGHHPQHLDQADAARPRHRPRRAPSTTCAASSTRRRRRDFFVRIDMENSPYVDVTLDTLGDGLEAGLPATSASCCSRRCAAARTTCGGVIQAGGRDAPREGRLQGAARGRLPGQGRGGRRVRADDAGAARRGALPRHRDPRREDDRRRPRRSPPSSGIAEGPLRVPDALRHPPRPADLAARPTATGCASTSRTAASGSPTSCAGSASVPPTSCSS